MVEMGRKNNFTHPDDETIWVAVTILIGKNGILCAG